MSRIAKWKLDKSKVKVVFRLQFHATHIPQSGWDKLFISFIPADSVKATAKTTKANVRNGTCKWADPIYETTRLLQDTKTKQYDEKLYKLVVAMGSSRSSVLGETTINLADYADAAKPSSIALPLHGCDSGTTLHVTVQLLTSKTGFREFEQQREIRERGLQTATDQTSPNGSSGGISSHMDKVNAKVRFKEKSKDISSLQEGVEPNEEYADSAGGFDGSSNTSGSLYAEKHETSSAHEVDSLKSTISGDIPGPNQSPEQEKGETSDHRFSTHGTSDWAPAGWCADNDLATAYEENNRLKGCLDVAQSSIHGLKHEVSSLQSNANQIGLEAQKLDEKLATEIKSGEQLAKEVSLLKTECSQLKDDLIRLTKMKSSSFTSREAVEKQEGALFQDSQLSWLKGILVVEDKVHDLQQKACFGFHNGDFRLLKADFEALLLFLEDLKQGTQKAISSVNESEEFVSAACGTELYQPEIDVLHCVSIPTLVSHDSNSVNATKAMEGKIFELLRELDESKAERETLAKKMDQMECYYEALIQELEETQRQVMGELQNLRNEHSTCMYTISSAKTEIETMHQNMNEQILNFSEEKHKLDSLNQELERRAFSAEAALKRARLNYSIAVDHLQKDLELLSVQVLSMYETNETLIRQAFADPALPSHQEYLQKAQNQKPNSEARNFFVGLKKQHLGGDILLEDLKKSLHLQEGLYRKVEEETCEMHFVNLYLDVFSKTLQETLLEAKAETLLMKERINDLIQQLGLEAESKELLTQKLQTAMDDIHFLNEYKATCTAKCNEMALQNEILEANLQDATRDNCLLKQKITEWELLTTEFKVFEKKYKAVAAEKTELADLLEKQSKENGNLQRDISSLKEELKTVKTEFDELASVKEKTQNSVNFLETKMQNMLSSYGESLSGLSFCSIESVSHNLGSKDLTDVMLKLEELQHNACEKIRELMEEKKALIDDRESIKLSLSKAESNMMQMKQKFNNDIREMVYKLDVSNAMVQKLQLKVDTVADKLKLGSKIEENHIQRQRELLSDLDHVEVELNQLSSEDKDFSNKILALEAVAEELERSRKRVADLISENQVLMVSLQNKSEEAAKLELEVKSSKESLQSLNDELHVERSLRNKLESTVTELSSELEEKQCQLHDFDQLKSEVVHLKQVISDIELEKSRIGGLLLQYEEQLKSLNDELLVERSLRNKLENTVTEHSSELEEKQCQLLDFDQSKSEVVHLKQVISDVELEKSRIGGLLLQCEKQLKSLNDELHVERSLRNKLENTITEISSDLKEKQFQLLDFDQLKSEVVHLKEVISDIELEKSRIGGLLLQCEEKLKVTGEESSSVVKLESQLGEMLENLIVTDVALVFTRTQYEALVEEVWKKNVDLGTVLNSCLAREVQCNEGNVRLLTSLETLRSELQASNAENRVLHETNSVLMTQLEEHRDSAESMTVSNCEDRNHLDLEVERLKHLVTSYEEEIDNMIVSREELEVKVLLLEAQLHEKLEAYDDGLMMLRNQCSELNRKLAEQNFKAEEFKNLSIHLKELKDKADAECSQLREKRDSDGPPTAMQESLRIAFIKEQYETKVQELKHQLSISKKHSEEMLWKLQDAVDEIENRKRSEASHLRKNEELGAKILELEAELQSLVSEKREKVNAYDMLKAELECSLMSFECCKEEKQKVEACLQECNEEKSKISAELTMVKELLDSSNEPVGRNVCDESLVAGTSSQGRRNEDKVSSNDSVTDVVAKYLERDSAMHHMNAPETCLVPVGDGSCSSTLVHVQPEQDVPGTSDVDGISSLALVNQENHQTDSRNLALIKAQSLKSSMDHLNAELERMKNENSLVSQGDHHYDSKLPGLQRELMQLHKVNEELESIYPRFGESPGGGNALERVLALEIELAGALQAKKKSSIHFQSSFLKQHSDEEAIFRSFRDINDLIKDMLEIKGKYTAVETELIEMHDRYSQLSIQFAEVEGERQKLMMTLKNVRSSRRAQSLFRTSSASLEDSLSQ